MASSIFRPVRVDFWEDFKVLECMTPEDKLVFLYVLTSKSSKQVGIYPITLKKMAFDIGYSIEAVNCIVTRLEEKHKVIKYNRETREIAIRAWGRHGFIRLGKPVIDCVRKELTEVKCTEFISYVASTIDNESLYLLYKEEVDKRTKNNLNSDSSTIRGQKEEKEKEKEEEKEEYKRGLKNGDRGVSTKGKYSTSNERKNVKFLERPSEELMEYARNL